MTIQPLPEDPPSLEETTGPSVGIGQEHKGPTLRIGTGPAEILKLPYLGFQALSHAAILEGAVGFG